MTIWRMLFVLGGALVLLLPVAVVQRRQVGAGGGSTAGTPDGPRALPSAPTRPAQAVSHDFGRPFDRVPREATSISTVAIGVFVGLWMFAITAGLVALAVTVAVIEANSGQ